MFIYAPFNFHKGKFFMVKSVIFLLCLFYSVLTYSQIISFDATPYDADRHEKITKCFEAPNYACNVKVLRVIDGDTIEIELERPKYLPNTKISVRLRNVYAPEISRASRDEIFLGYIAKAQLEQMVLHAKAVHLGKISKGSFFRLVADVIADGVWVNEKLRDLGYVDKKSKKKPKSRSAQSSPTK